MIRLRKGVGVRSYKVSTINALRMSMHQHPSTGTQVLAMLRKAMTYVSNNIGRIS